MFFRMCILAAAAVILGVPAALGADLGQTARQVTPSALNLSGSKLAVQLPDGVRFRVAACSHKPVIDLEGNIRKPLSPVSLELTLELSQGGATKLTEPLSLTIPGRVTPRAGANPKPAVIPALQEWTGADGAFSLLPTTRILVSAADSASGAPSLLQHMETFSRDMAELIGHSLPVVAGESPARPGDIVVSLSREPDFARLGREGYTLAVGDHIKLRAPEALGAFWGTRTLLQVFATNNLTFPRGSAADYPRYPLRGFMYDVGRKPAQLHSVVAVMKMMSYFKLNDLQLHINDNHIWLHEYTGIDSTGSASPEQKQQAAAEVLKAAPTAFRLESDAKGADGTPLTAPDFSYTKEEFGKLIDLARVYGVNIVPEIDVPGHAMSFVRVRPDLMYRGGVHKPNDVERTAMLDASGAPFPGSGNSTYRDETLKFVESVFDEYLLPQNGGPAVFRDAVVHIGTDEYYGDAEDYRAFADALLKYVRKRGFTPRLWGSLTAKPGNTPVLSEGVQMDIWSLGWQQPKPAFEAGYDLINILDATSYVVPNGTGNIGGYCDMLNIAHLYSPAWHPHIIGSYRVPCGHPQLLGAQWALWNDNSFRRDTGLIDADFYDRIRRINTVIAEKSWNSGTDRGFAEFQQLVEKVGVIPNLDPFRRPATKSTTYLQLGFDGGVPVDLSPNRHSSPVLTNASVATEDGVPALLLNGGDSRACYNLPTIAPDYTLELRVKRLSDSAAPQVLFAAAGSSFLAVQKDSGKVGVSRDTWDYSFDYTLPVGEWVTLKLVATGRRLILFADGREIGAPVRHQFPASHKYSTFLLPLGALGDAGNAFHGWVSQLQLTLPPVPDMSTALPADQLRVTASSEHGVSPDGPIADALDGNPATYWHSRYTPQKDNPPFTIEAVLRQPAELDMLSFLPRQDMTNGAITGAEVHLQTSPGGEWKKVAAYSGDGQSKARQAIPFPAQKAAAVRLIITKSISGFGTIAEFNLHHP